MSITSAYTTVPTEALIDRPVQCPACGQPLNVEHDWGAQLRATGNVMLCCTGKLTLGEANILLGRIKAARG